MTLDYVMKFPWLILSAILPVRYIVGIKCVGLISNAYQKPFIQNMNFETVNT